MGKSKDLATGETRFVNTAGDTMTGDLVVSKTTTPTIQIKDGQASGTRVSGKLHIGEVDTLGVSIENSTTSFNDNCAMVFKTSPAAGTLTERMRIDSSGRVTMPDQPVFKVGLSSTANTNNSTNTDIVWNESTGTYAFLNGGVTLNSSNGRVTVPVAGKYWVSVKLRSESTVFGYTDLNIKVNGSGIARIYHNTNPGYGVYQEANIVTVIVDLAANDYLSVGLHTGNAAQISATSNTVCWFNGFLIG